MIYELIFIGVGSFLLGAVGYFLLRNKTNVTLAWLFKSKKIVALKNYFRRIKLSTIPSNKRIDVYVLDKNIRDYEPEIIAEAEKLYIGEKQFDDLVEYISQVEFYLDEVFITKFKFFRKLNVNNPLVELLIKHNWKKRLIKKAFKKIERGLKQNGKPRKQTSLPRFEEQAQQDFEESTSSTSAGTNTRAISNDSGASSRLQTDLARLGNLQNGNVAPRREHKTSSYWDRFGA